MRPRRRLPTNNNNNGNNNYYNNNNYRGVCGARVLAAVWDIWTIYIAKRASIVRENTITVYDVRVLRVFGPRCPRRRPFSRPLAAVPLYGGQPLIK